MKYVSQNVPILLWPDIIEYLMLSSDNLEISPVVAPNAMGCSNNMSCIIDDASAVVVEAAVVVANLKGYLKRKLVGLSFRAANNSNAGGNSGKVTIVLDVFMGKLE